MAVQGSLLLVLGFLILCVNCFSLSKSAGLFDDPRSLNRQSFPPDFRFGAGSAAYQYEGAWNEDGKGPSIWDNFTHEHSDQIADHSNGDVAVDFYHRYPEDVRKLKDLGMNAFRFSISWSRILPNGKLSGGINPKGVQFYSDLIDELMNNGIEPYATIFHWDIPQALEDAYGGFLDSNIVNDFRDFADVCFRQFGDRVKNWMTFNEPYTFTVESYVEGAFPPARCSPWQGCKAGDSSTEPYIVTHNILLAHAAAVDVYKRKYQAYQNGKVGIALDFRWTVPYSSHLDDISATQRAADFKLGWYMDPLTYGDYPDIMKQLVGSRLPRFTQRESIMLRGSIDFLGLNYYTANYVFNVPPADPNHLSYATDSCANTTSFRNGTAIGTPSASTWLYSYPMGMIQILNYIKGKYRNPPIYITENGISTLKDASESLNDPSRIEYLQSHLYYLNRAIKEGVNVRGIFVWTLLDDFEWVTGYTTPFGLYYVNFEVPMLPRIPKASAKWLTSFLSPHKNADNNTVSVSSM